MTNNTSGEAKLFDDMEKAKAFFVEKKSRIISFFRSRVLNETKTRLHFD